MYHYNKRFIKIIRRSLKLTQAEMGSIIGITRGCLGTYERGRSRAGDFFCDRMLALYGIELRQPEDCPRIVFTDIHKVPPPVYAYLSGLEIWEEEVHDEERT